MSDRFVWEPCLVMRGESKIKYSNIVDENNNDIVVTANIYWSIPRTAKNTRYSFQHSLEVTTVRLP